LADFNRKEREGTQSGAKRKYSSPLVNSVAKTMQTLHLEPAYSVDIETLVQFHSAAFVEDEIKYGAGPPGHRDEAWHRAMLAQHHYFKMLWGALLVGGAIVVEKGEGHFYLDTLFIHPDYHNQGLGQQAMLALERAFPQARRWTLATPHQNFRNHHFYEKLGYRKIAEEWVTDVPNLATDFGVFVYEKLVS
jgi:ribosomal protein S18 acetylase RimI-like enzyme